MNLVRPAELPYDVAAWRDLPFDRRVAMVCAAWTDQGYGAPAAIYALYVAKIGLYVAGWVAWCAAGGLAPSEIGAWWGSETAFLKAALWTLLFEGLGLGCGSGPLTGRYLPPIGGALHFLRPGTIKLPLVPGLGDRRSWLDVAAYAAVLVLLVRALLAAEPGLPHLAPIALAIPVLGLLDRTLFLVFRSEHHWSVLVVWCLAPDAWVEGSKVVWLAIWWWAAASKLTPHFPSVIGVMTSNAPLAPRFLRRAMVRSFPDDLRPSRAAWWLAHTGTALEFGYPLLLLLGDGGPLTWVGLAVMAAFHLFILQQVPMGVPLEWNVIMAYGAFVLFGVHAPVDAFRIDAPLLVAWLVAFHLALPLFGSLFPSRVSFLLSMRYYAGNWASSVWLFAPGASEALDRHLVKSSRHTRKQLERFYDPDTVDGMISKVLAFRLMHLHGRALSQLARDAAPDLDAREWIDGEIVAGLALGWNFGDGHLHGPELLAAIQERCRFAPGELRVVMLESQPLFGATQAWTTWDAHDGLIGRGEVVVADLVERPVG